MLEPQGFVLFYPIPEDEDSFDVQVSLQIAYKKSDGKVGPQVSNTLIFISVLMYWKRRA